MDYARFRCHHARVEPDQWRQKVGLRLERARQAKGLSKRAAATLAGLSEITWRQLESGKRQVAPGVVVQVNPRDDTLAAAAKAVDLQPSALLASAGRSFTLVAKPGPSPDYPEDDEDPELSLLGGIWPDLSEGDRRMISEMAQRLHEGRR